MIRRAPRPKADFYILRNSIAEDSRVSWEARGMLIYLLTRPDDWSVCANHLAEVGACGRDRIYRILRELEDAGYVAREVNRAKDGRIVNSEWIVGENPYPDHQDTEKPDVDETTLTSTDLEQELNKQKTEGPASPTLPEWLDKEAWDEWVAYRKELRKPLKPSTVTKQLKFLSNHVGDHKEIIDRSITNGWTGLFELKKPSAVDRPRYELPEL